MRKKIFTFLLALAASVGLMNAAPNDSGSCGANVTYSFDGATGAMTITGTGPMTDFANKSDAPWDSYRTSITSVTITDGVTSVGKSSFGQCTSLTTVTIGNDVETIGEWAFNDCGEQFTSLTLGNSIRTIGNYAFLFGTGITGFTLPSTLETIGDYAFCQNRAITTLTIPSNVTSIGKLAFYNCNALTSITTEATTPPTLGETVFDKVPTSIPLNVPNGSVAAYDAAAQWTDFDIQGYDPAPGGGSTPANVCGDGLTWELNGGVLTISYDGEGTGEMYDFGYEYDENPVNVAPWKENKSAITTVIVGDGVKSIGNYAFNDLGENFTAVTIANSVERIGLSAFMNAKWITEITLPSSLKTIDRECFAANFGFTSITIPSGVTSIGYHAFGYCTGLTSLTCEATTPPTLASGVFYKITSKTSDMSSIPLYVPSGSVAAYEAAAQWNAFDIHGYDPTPTPANPSGSCGENLTWEFNTETGALTISGTGAMTSAPWETYYKEDITSLSLPDGLTAIPSEAFIGCSGLTTVTIPASVTSIGADAFRYCTSVTDVYCYPKADDLNWIDDYKDDFIYDLETRCHVYADEFDGYMDKYADADGVNVTFINDLEAVAVTTNKDPQHAGVYYSTYYNSAKKYILPAGCEAYTALLSGDVLTLAKIAEGGQVIPNGAAVILKSESASVSILPTETEAVAYNAETNSLQGRDAETALSTLGLTRETCYVLSGTTEHGVGFYHPNSDNLIAHKAYVPMAANTQSGAPRRLRFVFADEKTTTGVENVQGNDVQCTKVIENGVLVIIKNGVRYNAQGQIVK